MNFAKGVKTYIIAAIGVGLGIYEALLPYLHTPQIPTFAMFLLGAAGLGSLRSGITTDTQKAVTDVLQQITVPAPVQNVTVVNPAPAAPSVAQTEHFASSKNSTL